METTINIWKVTFTLTFNTFGINVQNDRGSIVWNLAPDTDYLGKVKGLKSGSMFAKDELKYFEEDIKKKALALWKKYTKIQDLEKQVLKTQDEDYGTEAGRRKLNALNASIGKLEKFFK